MHFYTKPVKYEKTILSDLQGAWECLRTTVTVRKGWYKMLFHIDEAMSWETVCHLERMRPLLVLFQTWRYKATPLFK
jgi:hypothetical protein